jgi:ATP/maltotriose-dependent transcriptional regulator MalT
VAARSQNDFERAIALLEEALRLIVDRGYWHLRTRIQLWLAETLLQRGRTDEAKPYLEAAFLIAREHGRVLLQLWSERLRARLVAAQGNWPDANVLFTETFERVSKLDFPLEVARTQAAWGETALLYAPAPHDGYALLAAARETFVAHEARGELQAVVLSL